MNAKFDGIYGMGFPSISATQTKSPLDSLYDAGRIKRRLFCFILNHKTRDSEVQLGGCEFAPTIRIPLTSPGYWQFNLSGVSVENGNHQLFQACQGGCKAIMDTGTSLITGPPDEITTINNIIGAKEIGNTGQYMMNCFNTDSLPHIAFAIGDGTVTLTPADYVVNMDVRNIICTISMYSIKNNLL